METQQIKETIEMISEENLDIRTITMGISLLDCVTGNLQTTADHVYAKIMKKAAKLVAVADSISDEYGIPIVNKRISVTPVSLLAGADQMLDFRPVAYAMDRAAKDLGVDLIGGYSALVQNGSTKAETALMKSLPEVLATTERVCASVNIGSTRSGLNMLSLLFSVMQWKIIRLWQEPSGGFQKVMLRSTPVFPVPAWYSAHSPLNQMLVLNKCAKRSNKRHLRYHEWGNLSERLLLIG